MPRPFNGRKLLFLPFFFLLLCACEKEEVFEPVPPHVYEECLYSKIIDMKDTVDEVLKQYGITDAEIAPYENELNLLLANNVRYDVHAITYHTVTPDGQAVLASGVIYYPRSRRPAGVIEISPVNKSKNDCGTEAVYVAEMLPGMAQGYICIMPDLIGCGASAQYPISYLQHANTAVVSADLRKAAEEFLWNRYQYRLSPRSILFGYSLGGSCAFALARHYQKHPELGVHVTHIFAGGGAYEPLEVVKAQLAADRSDYAVIPNILWSMNYYGRMNLDFSRLFQGPLLEHYEEWCDGYLPIARLTGTLGTKPSAYFSEALFNGIFTDPEFQPLREAMEEMAVPFDWVPDAKVYLFHAAEDHYVPTVCGDRMYAYLKENGADVRYHKYDAPHVNAGILIEVDFLKFLMTIFR